jgi:hypothetical protein
LDVKRQSKLIPARTASDRLPAAEDRLVAAEDRLVAAEDRVLAAEDRVLIAEDRAQAAEREVDGVRQREEQGGAATYDSVAVVVAEPVVRPGASADSGSL